MELWFSLEREIVNLCLTVQMYIAKSSVNELWSFSSTNFEGHSDTGRLYSWAAFLQGWMKKTHCSDLSDYIVFLLPTKVLNCCLAVRGIRVVGEPKWKVFRSLSSCKQSTWKYHFNSKVSKVIQVFSHVWFAAIMTNCMTWNMEDPEPFLEVDVRLNVTLEVVYCSSDSFFRNPFLCSHM